MKSLAAVFRGQGQPFSLESLQVPELESGQILVAVTCCTLCGSDVHTIRGDRQVAGPTILGHEMIGVVHQISSAGSPCRDVDGQTVRVGDRVTWSVAASCRACFYCRNELPQKCERLFKYGHESISDRHPLSGGLSQFCQLVEGTTIVKLPGDLPDRVVCPANCATATVAAALRTADGVAGKSVLIHGGGMLGLTATAMARTEKAKHIILTDPVERRCQLAMQFGATEAVNANDERSIGQAIQLATDGRGADLVMEMSGAAAAVERSLGLLRVGGRLVLVGSVFPSRSIVISPERLVRNMIRIDGVHNYHPSDLVKAIRFLQSTRSDFPFHDLVGAEYSLREVDAAVRDAIGGHSPRIAIRPNE